MREFINHLLGFILVVILTLFAGLIGCVIGIAVWAVSIWMMHRAEDRKMMKDFLERNQK